MTTLLRSAHARVYRFLTVFLKEVRYRSFYLTHRYVICERCGLRTRHRASDWEWLVTNFTALCPPHRADFETEQTLFFEEQRRRDLLRICTHCFTPIGPNDLTHAVDYDSLHEEHAWMCDFCWKHSQ